MTGTRSGGVRWWIQFLATLIGLVIATPVRGAAPFGHYILAKRLAEDIRDGKVPAAPRELVEALQNPEMIRFFCGGAVAPDLNDKWTHHDGRPQKIGADLMQSARTLLETANRTGSPMGKMTAQQNLVFAYGWLHHCATDLAVHPAVNAVQGDAFSYTSPLKQGLHGNMESDLDAYVHKFLARPGEVYDPAFPIPQYIEEKLDLLPDAFVQGRNTLAIKVAAELGMKNIEQMELSAADFQAKWGKVLQQSDREAKQFIEAGRLPGDCDLDAGKMSSKDYRRFHEQVKALNGGKMPSNWGYDYLDWWEQIKNLDGQARQDRLAQLLNIAAQIPACFSDLPGKLSQITAAWRGSIDARTAWKAALAPVTTLTQSKNQLDAASNLPAEVAGVAAIIRSATANDPRPVFEKLKQLEQAASVAALAACEAAKRAAQVPDPYPNDVALAQQSAADVAAAATAAATAAQPILDASNTVRDQLQAKRDLAQRIQDSSTTAADFPASLTGAETALLNTRAAAAPIHQAQQTIENLYNEIVRCASEVEQTLTPALATRPSFAGHINTAESIVANCLSPRQAVIGQGITAETEINAAEGEVRLVKGKLAGLPDFRALSQQWQALQDAGQDYLAGGGTVEAWLGRIQQLANLARKCATRAGNAATTAAATAPDPALGGKVRVPVVVALTEQAAIALLSAKRLTPHVERTSGAPAAPEAAFVNAQSPDAGTLVETGTVVNLVMGDVASVQPFVDVPDVVGLSAAEAYAKLTSCGLLADTVCLNETPPAGKQGTVRTQNPAAAKAQDKRARRGNIVLLRVYGQVVPGVIGWWYGAALPLLSKEGLKPDKLDYGNPPPRPDLEDCVQDQAPAPGSSPPADKIVKVWVYGAYTGQWNMPEVIGKDKLTALTILANHGLFKITAKLAPTPAPTPNQAGIVLQQTPFAGSRVNKDTAVELTLFGTSVPNVKGLTLTAAQNELIKAGFKVGTTSATSSAKPATKEQEFTVQSQRPTGGSYAEGGSTVELVAFGKYEPAGPTISAGTGGQAPKKLHLRYVVKKVTGTDYSGQPRDWADESKGDWPGLEGTIPLTYSESWDTSYANMNGFVTIALATPGPGAAPSEPWVTIQAQASWNNKGLGFGRPTGIFINGSFGKDAKDDKGSFDNGSTSANASWTGPLGGGVTVTVRGKENRVVTFTTVKE